MIVKSGIKHVDVLFPKMMSEKILIFQKEGRGYVTSDDAKAALEGMS